MKAICISACEIAGVGIIDAGDEVELADGFYNDERVRQHFHIVESSVKNKKAKPPDMMAEADGRRERFAKSLADHTAQIVALNRLVDSGADLPRELLEPDRDDAPTESERIEKIVELWCDTFGYEFPTDGAKQPAKQKEAKESKGTKEPKEEPTEAPPPPPPANDGGEGEGAQMSLLDKLNGK